MIAFIDCYIESPANHCVNSFVEKTKIPCTYHMASKFGINSLNDLTNPTAYVILGSASHATDYPEWQAQLLDFIHQKLQNNIPVLGICYGHQAVAHYFGCELGHIFTAKTVLKESRKIQLSKSLWKLPDEMHLAFSHSQIITKLTNDFEEIASSNLPNEIIRHKTLPFYGIQAHPEASIHFLKNETELSFGDYQSVLSTGHDFLEQFYHHSQLIMANN